MKSKKVKNFLLLGLLALCCTVVTPAKGFCEVTNPNYQVFVANLAGTPIVDPIAVTVTFYDSAVGGAAFWSETQTVTPDSGLCVLNLGAVTPFNLDFSHPYYVAVNLAGTGELPSRISVPGPGTYSRSGDKINTHAVNVKYEWLNLE